MLKISDKIKKLRKENKLTQAGLAKVLKVSPSTVSAWELGTNVPLMDKIVQLSNYFDVSTNYFFDDLDITSVNMASVPVHGEISCGNGRINYDEPTDYEEIPMDWLNGGEYFMLYANGDSMSGSRIYNGDKLLIRKQEEVENGELGIVVVEDNAVLKKINKQGNILMLESTNINYPTRIYDLSKDNNVKIIGKLKKLIIDF